MRSTIVNLVWLSAFAFASDASVSSSSTPLAYSNATSATISHTFSSISPIKSSLQVTLTKSISKTTLETIATTSAIFEPTGKTTKTTAKTSSKTSRTTAKTTIKTSSKSTKTTPKISSRTSTSAAKISSKTTKSSAKASSKTTIESTAKTSAKIAKTTIKAAKSTTKAASKTTLKTISKTTSRTATKSAVASTKAFEISNSDLYLGSYSTDIYFDILDPRTSNTTTCAVEIQGFTTDAPPLNVWSECTDNTFSYNLTKWSQSDSAWSMILRHQYRFAGEACLRPDGPDCVTTLGHISFNATSCYGKDCVWTSVNQFGPDPSITITWSEPCDASIDSICKAGECVDY